MTPARLRWGLILVQVGVLILLVNLDIINYNFVPNLVYALPFLLILIGIEKVFTRSKAEAISYLAVFGIFAGGIFIAAQSGGGDDYQSFFSRTDYQQDFDPKVKQIRAEVHIGDGDLEIRDVTDDMFYARFAEMTRKPRIRYNVENDQAEIRLQEGSGAFWGDVVHIDIHERNDWKLYFSKSTPLSLECYGDDSDIHLNLATTPLRSLILKTDDSKMYVKVGELEPIVRLDIESDRSDLRLRLPNGASVEINGGEFAAYLERIGFVKQNGHFVSQDFDSLASQILINIDEKLDNLKIEFY